MSRRPTPDGEGRHPDIAGSIVCLGRDTHPIETRAAATGVEAEFLTEAAQRLESVGSFLAAGALGHIAEGDVLDALPEVVALVDRAARLVDLAGGER